MAAVLQSLNYSVNLLCYFEYNEIIVGEFESSGIAVRLLNLNRGISAISFIKKLKKEIRLNSPDIIHVQYMAPGALPIIAARLSGVRRVYATVHQPFTNTHGKRARFLLNSASYLTQKFITVSQNAEQSWFGSSTLFDETRPVRDQPRHFTIHNAIDIEKIKDIVSKVDEMQLKHELNIPVDLKVIGSVARLRCEKGIDLLLAAFKQLLYDGTEAHLIIVGTGPDELKLKDAAESFGLNNNVTFYGEATWEKAVQLMSIMDIVVVPSRFEGFGLTAAEAMAVGKPVIASETSGLKEIIIDGETGLAFKTGNSNDLAEKIKILLQQPDLCEELAINGLKRAEEYFSIEVFRQKLNSLYS
ncbi:MAG: glycosyltransferase [Bacteroidales bacterium]|nr:glycosyltransferase [Bacteroidales bacterium]